MSFALALIMVGDRTYATVGDAPEVPGTQRAAQGARMFRVEMAERSVGTWLRRMVLTVFVLTAVGTMVELALLEHYESVWQWSPFVVLMLGVIVAGLAAFIPSVAIIRAFQAVMILAIAAALLGLYLHYKGNVEFELEMYPSLGGLDLFWKSITGATPALAPGMMGQLGVLGLAYCYRHPVLSISKETQP